MRQAQSDRGISRRQFVKVSGTTFGATLGFHFIPHRAWGQLEKPTLAGIGAGGKGRSDIDQSAKSGFHVISLVDIVDANKLSVASGRLRSMADVRSRYSDAAFFTDYREMLDTLGDKVDAVTVSTPDHHHFHASVLAMQAGKHVYCQKPLTHGIWEARMMARVAAKTGAKTQMGNQAHASDRTRRCVELIRAGVIGKVKEIHAWTNRPIWPQGFDSPPPTEKVPAAIDWNQWIGPAPWTEYSSSIAPFSWRGWWNYGTGALGDMACHIMDMGYWAMQPGAPRSVVARQVGATDLSPPISSTITWEFAPNRFSATEGFRYLWYDGYRNARFERDGWKLVKENEQYNHPDDDVLEGMDFRKFGCVVVGEHGKLFFNRGGRWVLKATHDVDGFAWPQPVIPRARGQNSYHEWRDAIDGKISQAQSNFGMAGPFTETILLGVLAQRFPDTVLHWDAATMEIKGRPELAEFVRRPYRSGWEIDV